MAEWRFDSEFSLEEFLWSNLSSALSLEPLERQYAVSGQLCDILAKSADGQLAILELKNVEDRYVCSQLTRYFEYIKRYQPFSEQVDYEKPIRLIAIAPSFHEHNFIDRQHSTLDFEFWAFRIYGDNGEKKFECKSLDCDIVFCSPIPRTFENLILKIEEQDFNPEPNKAISRPPKSFRLLIENLDAERQDYLLNLRKKILNFDDQMLEVGLTKRTQYGLKKGNKEIFKGKICAELAPCSVFAVPKLYLALPYPKGALRKPTKFAKGAFSKGYTTVQVPLFDEDWKKASPVGIFAGKSNIMSGYAYPSLTLSVEKYCEICESLLEYRPVLKTTEDFVDFALLEWKRNLESVN